MATDSDSAADSSLVFSLHPSKLLISLALVAASVTGAVVVEDAAPANAGGHTSRFVPVTPCRLLDTRGGARVGNTRVQVHDRCGIPNTATAAVLTVTSALSTAPGFIVATPAGVAPNTISTVNFAANDIRANSTIVKLGDGAVVLNGPGNTHAVVDVSGYFVPATSSTGGRFVGIDPQRVLDTRLGGGGRFGNGETRTIDLGIPAGATAVSMMVAATQTAGAGHFTAWANGSRPQASILNVDAANQTRAATVTVPVNSGTVQLYALTASHVVIDVTGYFTGDGDADAAEGLFVPLAPFRMVDTRPGGTPLWNHGAREFPVAIASVDPAGISAITANVAVTQSSRDNWISVRPAGRDDGASPTSTVNALANTSVSNSTLVSVSTRGIVAQALRPSHAVIDVTGYFTGTPLVANQPALPANTPTRRNVTVISDSAMAGVRWNGALFALQGANYTPKLESCRRLVRASCSGREGYAPRTAHSETLNLPNAGPNDMLVIAVGYNDSHFSFASDFELVVGAARAKGFKTIGWLTYRSDNTYRLPGFNDVARSNYALMNSIIKQKVASGAFSDVLVFDHDAWTANAPGTWFTSDGVHQRYAGSLGSADFISRAVTAFDGFPCPKPARPGEAVESPCIFPNYTPAALPDVVAVYG